MKINWKLRFKNRATFAALIAGIVALIYQILGILGITAPISEGQVTQLLGVVINLLTVIGVLVDPTTEGTCDSTEALCYEKPRCCKR